MTEPETPHGTPSGASPRREAARLAAAADADARRTRVRRAEGSRYGRGTGYRHVSPPPEPETAGPPRKGRVQSVLGALPVLMLVSGLYIYYGEERAQSRGAPLVAESVETGGVFERLSTVGSGGDGRHYLWFDDGTRTRGVRIPPGARTALEVLAPGDALDLRLAPTVSGSRTLWAWRVERGEEVLLDDAARLR